MTPKEIVERVRLSQRTRLTATGVVQDVDDIDHLLAIHAAVIGLFDALANMRGVDTTENILKHRAAVQKKRDNLAALCGWKAEEA